jgi:hypothetical protein
MPNRLLKLVALGFLLFCTLPFLLLTRYNQPYWDDYLFAALYREKGLLAAFQHLYLHAGGRFSSHLLSLVGNPLSYGWVGGMGLAALLAIGAQVASIFFALQTVTNRALPWWQSCCYSLGLWLVFVCTCADIHSALYWFSGLMVHQLGCCLLLVVPAAVARAQQSIVHRRRWLFLAAAATGLLAGTSELSVWLLGLVLLTATGRSLYAKQYDWAKKWGFLLLVLCIGFGIVLVAPGNYERMASSPKAPSTALSLVAQIGHGLRLVMWQPVFFALLVVPALFSPLAPYLLPYRPAGLRLPLLASAGILLLGIGGGTAMLSLLIGPDLLARGVNVLCWWTLLGWLVACWASLPADPAQLPRFSGAVRTLAAVLLVVVVAAPTIRAWQEALWEAPQWARQCEARDALYRAARGHQGKLTVPPITHVTPRYVLVRGYDIQPFYNHPLNISVARYFQLDSVRTDARWPIPAAF